MKNKHRSPAPYATRRKALRDRNRERSIPSCHSGTSGQTPLRHKRRRFEYQDGDISASAASAWKLPSSPPSPRSYAPQVYGTRLRAALQL